MGTVCALSASREDVATSAAVTNLLLRVLLCAITCRLGKFELVKDRLSCEESPRPKDAARADCNAIVPCMSPAAVVAQGAAPFPDHHARSWQNATERRAQMWLPPRVSNRSSCTHARSVVWQVSGLLLSPAVLLHVSSARLLICDHLNIASLCNVNHEDDDVSSEYD